MATSRQKLASNVRQAIKHIRACMDTATDAQMPMLEEDLHMAMDDYMNLMDEDMDLEDEFDGGMDLEDEFDEFDEFDGDMGLGMDYVATSPENREHVAYILDKVADVMSSIETQEQESGRIASISRTRLASYVKELSSVVASSNMRTASAGNRLDSVGVKVMEMRSEFV